MSDLDDIEGSGTGIADDQAGPGTNQTRSEAGSSAQTRSGGGPPLTRQRAAMLAAHEEEVASPEEEIGMRAVVQSLTSEATRLALMMNGMQSEFLNLLETARIERETYRNQFRSLGSTIHLIETQLDKETEDGGNGTDSALEILPTIPSPVPRIPSNPPMPDRGDPRPTAPVSPGPSLPVSGTGGSEPPGTVVSRSGYATLRPEAPPTFTGKPEELKDWIVAVEEYMLLYGLEDDSRKFVVAKQFMASSVRKWVQSLDGVSGWVALSEEMKDYFKDDLERHRAWGMLAKIKQLGSVKDYTDKFLQTIVLLGKMDEEQKIERFISGLKENLQDDVELARVKGDLQSFNEVKKYAEMLDTIKWKNSRKTSHPGASGSSSGASKGTGSSSSSSSKDNSKSKPRFQVAINAIMDSHQLSADERAKCTAERRCFVCKKEGHRAKECPDKKQEPKN